MTNFESQAVIKRRISIFFLMIGFFTYVGSKAVPALAQATPEQARSIAKEAYIYGYPIVDNYRIMYTYFVDKSSPEYKAPYNTLHNTARVYTPEDKAIQTPNSDTPYSQLGVDLRAEPLVITVPAMEKKRYFSLQLIDMYTHNYAYIGSRTTGNNGGHYLLTGPNWHGEKPRGITQIIPSETNFGFILYRTQLLSNQDLNHVKKVQSGYKVQTLSQFMHAQSPKAMPETQWQPKAVPTVQWLPPLTLEEQRTSPDFFKILNFALQGSPTHPSEEKLMAEFAQIGVGPGKPFDVKQFSPEMQAAIEAGMKDAWGTFNDYKISMVDTGKAKSSDLFGTRDYLKNDYLKRMAGAVLGIYGNSKDEAIYLQYFVDTEGQKLNGTNGKYTLRFAPNQLPPVNAFWSVTLYELPSSLLYANKLNRYLLNSPMLPKMKHDADGGMTLYIQHESPGAAHEANWLPAPQGPFWLVMRLYWPKDVALSGEWRQPPVQK